MDTEFDLLLDECPETDILPTCAGAVSYQRHFKHWYYQLQRMQATMAPGPNPSRWKRMGLRLGGQLRLGEGDTLHDCNQAAGGSIAFVDGCGPVVGRLPQDGPVPRVPLVV